MSEEMLQEITNSAEYYKSNGQKLITSINFVETQFKEDKNKQQQLKLLKQIQKSHENPWIILQQPIPSNQFVLNCDIDQNFKQIVASYGDGSILLINAITFQTIQIITKGLVNQCFAQFSQDNRFIYCHTGKILQVWLRTSQQCKLLFTFPGIQLPIQEITSNHGSLYLNFRSSFIIQRNCWNQKQIFKYFQVIPDKIQQASKKFNSNTLTISRDSKFIASIDKDILIICSSSKEIIQRWEGHQAQGISIKFSNDGLTLATSAEDRVIKIWSLSQVNNSQLVKQINYSAAEPIVFGFTKFDHHLILKTQNTIIIAGVKKNKIMEDYRIAQNSYGYGKRGILLLDSEYKLSLIRQK